MFQKPFRVKSQTSIKGSDRKKLRAEVGKQFPQFSEEELKNVVPNKEEMTVMKMYTHSGDNVMVYNLQRNPAFFEIDRVVYPTVYTLWKHPELMPVFTTWPPVFRKLVNGADLMLPGVIIPGQVSPAALGNLKKASPCAVKLLGNKAPVAVGKTALSSEDMFGAAMRGKGVNVLHTYRDQLWAYGEKSDPPTIADTEMLQSMKVTDTYQDSDSETDTDADTDDGTPEGAASKTNGATSDCNGAQAEDFGDDGENVLSEMEKLELEKINKQYAAAAAAAVAEVEDEDEDEEDEEDLGDTPEEQDSLLFHCLLCAVKTGVKKNDLPVLTSKFFRSHMQPHCPTGKTLDVKKSSHKKLSKFLQSMQKQGLVNVKELSKGVDSITAIHRDHPEVRSFVLPPLPDPEGSDREASTSQGSEYRPPVIVEMYTISAVTLPVFKSMGWHKRNALTVQQVRQTITDYVKENNLYHPDDRGFVRLDPFLSDAVLNKGDYTENLRWDDLFQRCLTKMNTAYQLTFPGQAPVIKKGKIEPVVLNIASRGGNKKVTLIHNLELFGIEPAEFAHRIQLGVACSTSVSPLPGKNKGLEVLVQGNQINYVASLLTDKYQLPKKFLQGTEKAKSGKKKR